MIKIGKLDLDLLDILLVLVAIVTFYLLISYMFGNTPTEFQVTLFLFTIFWGFLSKIAILLYNLNREFGEFKVSVINSFKEVKRDIGEIKEKLNKIEVKLGV